MWMSPGWPLPVDSTITDALVAVPLLYSQSLMSPSWKRWPWTGAGAGAPDDPPRVVADAVAHGARCLSPTEAERQLSAVHATTGGSR